MGTFARKSGPTAKSEHPISIGRRTSRAGTLTAFRATETENSMNQKTFKKPLRACKAKSQRSVLSSGLVSTSSSLAGKLDLNTSENSNMTQSSNKRTVKDVFTRVSLSRGMLLTHRALSWGAIFGVLAFLVHAAHILAIGFEANAIASRIGTALASPEQSTARLATIKSDVDRLKEIAAATDELPSALRRLGLISKAAT